MPTPIRYPDTTGYRASFPSIVVKVDAQEFPGFVAVNAERTRERVLVYGANADPIGKTRGKNTYKASLGVYLAEFNAFMIQHFGAGWGDRQFTFEITVTENGYDTQTARCAGCTIDVTKWDFSESADPLKVEGIELNPTKIVWNGVDDNARPLRGAPALG
jgi:hypothetical protein